MIALRLSCALVVACWACGCSLVGFGIGAAVDGATPPYSMVSHENLAVLKSGDHIRVLNTDFSTIEGTYKGATQLNADTYEHLFREFSEGAPGGLRLPAPGDTLVYQAKGATESAECVLRSYKARGLNVARLPRDSDTLHLPLSNIWQIEKCNSRNKKWVGAAVGLGVDVAVLRSFRSIRWLPPGWSQRL